tara:strand:+ start:581 stop:1369 length:789 start_codon:yes stop_codon:yes gene_type:complete
MKLSFKNINIINLDNLPTFKNNLTDRLKYFENLSKIIDNNFLISDNYEEISFFRQSFVIANFFWCIEFKKTKYFSKLNKYLKQNKSFVFGNHYFSANYIRKLENYKSIGFFGPEFKSNSKINNKILFVKGFGSNRNNFESKFKFLYRCLNKKYDIVFDKNIYIENISNIKYLESISSKSLSDINLIIGRPSFGILTEALSRKIPFYPISDIRDKESIEMKKQINQFFKKGGGVDEYVVYFKKVLNDYNFEFNAETNILKFLL